MNPVDPVRAPGTDDPTEYMCPNCVTPWKCNGPHIPDPSMAEESGEPTRTYVINAYDIGYRRGLRHHYLAVIVGFAIAFLLGAGLTWAARADAVAPGGIIATPTTNRPQGLGASASVGAPSSLSLASQANALETPPPLSLVLQANDSLAPSPTGYEPPAVYGGLATWYDDGEGLYAAVPSYRFGDPRYPVQVCHEDRCVIVTVRDFCACPGARVIDLGPDAFVQLAPLARGVIPVTVESILPPATDSR